MNFAARLRIYAVVGVIEGSLITGQIGSGIIWDHELGEEGLADTWRITYNRDTGNFEITAL